jgi:hypothetical protein
MGRLRVIVPEVLESVEVWAMPCVPYAGPDVGFWFVPSVGASVWVEFEGGNVDIPIWTGCFWEQGQLPVAFSEVARRMIKTESALLDLDDPGGRAQEFEAPSSTTF